MPIKRFPFGGVYIGVVKFVVLILIGVLLLAESIPIYKEKFLVGKNEFLYSTASIQPQQLRGFVLLTI
ncbi:hypothetical protein CLOHAE12215_00044 [Clostridium haemolyticum]|nr:hypothetical protein CLOHAE12215_00044 [Clostridium haemolyticum]